MLLLLLIEISEMGGPETCHIGVSLSLTVHALLTNGHRSPRLEPRLARLAPARFHVGPVEQGHSLESGPLRRV